MGVTFNNFKILENILLLTVDNLTAECDNTEVDHTAATTCPLTPNVLIGNDRRTFEVVVCLDKNVPWSVPRRRGDSGLCCETPLGSRRQTLLGFNRSIVARRSTSPSDSPP